jgi:ABC-type transport system involved in multi-copper enzyme maturation permease subunit
MTALHSEWIKLRSVRSTAWALLAIVGLTIGLGVVSCSTSHTEGAGPGDSEDVVVRLSLVGVYFAQVAVVALGVLAICGEYATGTIRATFLANPRRREVLAAKSAVVGALVLGAGAVGAVAAFYVGQAILHANGYTPDIGYPAASLGDADTLRMVAVAAVYPMILAVLSLGVAAIVRSTAAAISVLLGALFVPWIVGGILPESLARAIQKATPMAGIAAQENGAPIGPWAGLGVTVAWAVAALVAALWLIARRDA